VVSLYKINKILELKELQEKPVTEAIPKEHHEFLPLFDMAISDKLLPHHPYDNKI
jgi:hypothetical protein